MRGDEEPSIDDVENATEDDLKHAPAQFRALSPTSSQRSSSMSELPSLTPDVRHLLWDACFITVFYVVGVTVVGALKDEWSITDRIYFLSVTVSTVGYGDLTLSSDRAKLLCSLIIIVGVTLVFSIMKKYAMILHYSMACLHRRAVAALGIDFVAKPETLPIHKYSPETVNAMICYSRQYAVALMPLLLLSSACFVVAHFHMGLNVVDSLYFTVVTCSTVGYGDYTPKNSLDRAYYGGFLLALVCVVSNTINEMAAITTQHRVRRGKIARVDIEKVIMRKARGDPDGTEPVVTESDFIVEALVKDKLIDETVLTAIRRNYYWTALRNQDHAMGVITARCIYTSWYNSQRSMPASQFDLASSPQETKEVDDTPWSYETWRHACWEERLERARDAGRADKRGPDNKSSPTTAFDYDDDASSLTVPVARAMMPKPMDVDDACH